MTTSSTTHDPLTCAACQPLSGRRASHRRRRVIPNPLRVAYQRAWSYLQPGARVGTLVKRGSSAQLNHYAQVGCAVEGCPEPLPRPAVNPAGLPVCREHWYLRPVDCEPPADDRSEDEIDGVRLLTVLAGQQPEWWPLSRVPRPGEQLRPELLDWIDDPDHPDSDELAIRKEAVRIVSTGPASLDGPTTPTFWELVDQMRGNGAVRRAGS